VTIDDTVNSDSDESNQTPSDYVATPEKEPSRKPDLDGFNEETKKQERK